jgi:hypothetical protein
MLSDFNLETPSRTSPTTEKGFVDPESLLALNDQKTRIPERITWADMSSVTLPLS